MGGVRSNRSVTVVAILAASLLWLLWPTGEETATIDAAPAAADPAEQGPAEHADVPITVPTERSDLTEPVPPPQPEPDLAHPFAFRLDLRLVDSFGLPVPGALVFAAPPLCGLSLWPEASDGRGMVRLRWSGRQARMQVQVAILVWGVLQPMRLFDLDADRTHTPMLVVRGKEQSEEALLQLRQRTSEQTQRDAVKVRRGRLRRTDELDLLCGRTLLLFREFECTNCHEQSRLAGYATLARAGMMSAGLHPASRFQDLRTSPLTEAQRRERQLLLEQSEQLPGARPMHGPGERAFVRGMVRGPDGKPVADVPVACLGEDGSLKRRTLTNAEGHYRLGPLVPGFLTVVAGGGDEGDARTALVVNEPETWWDFQLARTGVLFGCARDENGGALVDWRVEYESVQGDWADFATTRKDGSFVMPSVPAIGQCLLWPGDVDLHLPVLYGRAAAPESDPIVFWLDRAMPTRARLRVRPLAAGGAKAPAQIDARIFQLDTGRGAILQSLGWDDFFELGGLPAGPYRVEVGAPMSGWVDCGLRQLDGRGLWDLGIVRLSGPSRVRLLVPPGMPSPLKGEHAFYRRTDAVDILEDAVEHPDGELMLPPGDHLLLWRQKEQLRALAFTVAAGAVTDVGVPLR